MPEDEPALTKTLEQHKFLLKQANPSGRVKGYTENFSSSRRTRMSPSPQHLAMLHRATALHQCFTCHLDPEEHVVATFLHPLRVPCAFSLGLQALCLMPKQSSALTEWASYCQINESPCQPVIQSQTEATCSN